MLFSNQFNFLSGLKMSVVPTNTQVVSYEGSFCKELEIRMNKILNKSQRDHDRESAIKCYIHKELSLDEYDEWIQDMNTKIDSYTNIESPERALLMKELSYINRDRERLMKFQDELDKKRKTLIYSYTHPLDYAIDIITKDINMFNQNLLSCIFESFVNKVKSLCPKDKSYEGTIKFVYYDRTSTKVINLFDSLTQRLISSFTKLLAEVATNEYFANDIHKYDSLVKLREEISNACYNLYLGTIIDAIDNKLDQYPPTEMSSSELVIGYSRVLMKNLNEYILHDLSKIIDKEIKDCIAKICENELVRSSLAFGNEITSCLNMIHIKEPKQSLTEVSTKVSAKESNTESQTTPIVEEPKQSLTEASNTEPEIAEVSAKESNAESQHTPIIAEVYEIAQEKTLDDFIKGLPNDKICIVELTQKYNAYFDTNVNPRGLGVILSKTGKLRTQFLLKTIAWEKSKRVIYYSKA